MAKNTAPDPAPEAVPGDTVVEPPAPPPPHADKSPGFWSPQTKPLWIAIAILSAVLIATISFSLGRMSADDHGPGFRIERFDGDFPGQGPGIHRDGR